MEDAEQWMDRRLGGWMIGCLGSEYWRTLVWLQDYRLRTPWTFCFNDNFLWRCRIPGMLEHKSLHSFSHVCESQNFIIVLPKLGGWGQNQPGNSTPSVSWIRGCVEEVLLKLRYHRLGLCLAVCNELCWMNFLKSANLHSVGNRAKPCTAKMVTFQQRPTMVCLFN